MNLACGGGGGGGGGEGGDGGGGGAVSEFSRHLAASGGEQQESRDFAATAGGWSSPIRGVVRTYIHTCGDGGGTLLFLTRECCGRRETGAA